MSTQTRYFQQDIIQEARQSNTLGDLYWYVEAEFPRRMLPAGIRRRQPAQWPMGFIPTLPAGPDVEEQQAWAELLAALFESGNGGRGITFKATLTTVSLLDGLRWYQYGEPIAHEVDHICAKCGQITRAPAGVQVKCECYAW